ncbi:hypothetical protein BG004_002246 [Podila humilis]|nr:hypothetical protein BG004_002246 [Podila humilis]
MEYWLQRCSICFDSRLDFCLQYCRDQYCRDCFQRYVKEVVSNSWGLDVTKIKCPVCEDTIPLSEWSKYVDQATRDQYQQYNQPYRSFSRFCHECEEEVFVSQVNKSLVGAPTKEMLPSFESLLSDLKSIVSQGGFTLDSSLSQHTQSSRYSADVGSQRKNALAQTLVKKFSNDYEAFCATAIAGQSRLPSMAHAYLSNLSFRSLVTQSPQTQPHQHRQQQSPQQPQQSQQSQQPQQQQQQQQHQQQQHQQQQQQQHVQTVQTPAPVFALNTPPSSLQPPAWSHSLATSTVRTNQMEVLVPPAGTAIQRPVPLQQRRHQRPAGVLEIYQSLMSSLLELFDLRQDGGESLSRSNIRLGTMNSGMKDQDGFEMPDSNGGDTGQSSGINRSTSETSSTLTISTHTDMNETELDPCIPESQSALKRPRSFINKIMTRSQTRKVADIRKLIVHFSKSLSSLETRPDQWKELQFLHVRWLRWDWCQKCDHELCLQCGEATHHDHEDCFTYLQSSISSVTAPQDSRRKRAKGDEKASVFGKPLSRYKGKHRSDQEATTLQWKLQNTNPCPNCCILIHRDDGCNKVDCMLCGFRFCWICREAWGVDCGFYKCGRQSPESSVSGTLIQEGQGALSSSDDVVPETQVESLGIAGVGAQVPRGSDGGVSQMNRMGDRPEEMFIGVSVPSSSDKPEIGVPNVYVIQQKRARF